MYDSNKTVKTKRIGDQDSGTHTQEGKGAVCCKGRAVRQSFGGIIYIHVYLQYDEMVKVNFEESF